MKAIDFADDIHDMFRELEILRAENTYLREVQSKYLDLLNSDIKHGEQMMGAWLELLLSDRVKLNAPEVSA